MDSFEQLFELVKRAVLLRDILVVGYIVAHILLRRLIERREPDSVNAEAFYVIELLHDTLDIADAVAVSVAEASRPNLVYCHLFIPALIGAHVPLPSFF